MMSNTVQGGLEERLSAVMRLSDAEKDAVSAKKGMIISSPRGDGMNKLTPSQSQPEDIYNIAYNGTMINPWGFGYVGLIINYFCVGIIKGGSMSLMYPILVVMNNEEPSVVSSAKQLVSLWWSYKLFFGILSDCFPIFGLKRKPYIFVGWLISSLIFVFLGIKANVPPTFLVIMLSFACFGYVMADVAADGFVVWMAHREPIEKRGKFQTLIYIARFVGEALASLLVGFTFSGPNVQCPGYQEDRSMPCRSLQKPLNYGFPEGIEVIPNVNGSELQDISMLVLSENSVLESEWCHVKCTRATFDFDISVNSLAWILCFFSAIGLPAYYILKEDKAIREPLAEKIATFWSILQKRAVWQIVLYTMNSTILMAVYVNAKDNANNAWLSFSPLQNSVLTVMDTIILAIGLIVLRTWCLNTNWRTLVVMGTILQVTLATLYLIIVYNQWRNSYFYMVSDVTSNFVATLNFLVGVLYIVEVSEPGYEAVTYAMITTSHNAVIPLGTVLSNQIAGWFDLTDAQLNQDDMHVRNEFTKCHVVVMALNMLSLISLPLLPRQKREARELLMCGETSKGWGISVMAYAMIAIVYSSVSNFATMAPSLKCYKVLGGEGCNEDESSIPAYILVALTLGYGFVTTYMVGYHERVCRLLSKLGLTTSAASAYPGLSTPPSSAVGEGEEATSKDCYVNAEKVESGKMSAV